MDIQGRVALVTGASRGIGEAIALRLAEAGADVVVGYGRNRQAAEAVAERIRQKGRRAGVAGADLGDPEQVRRVVDNAERLLGPVEILISNAGMGRKQDLAEITVEDWDRVLNVNLRAAFLLSQRVIPGMRDRGWGRVVFVSSVAAFTGGIVGPHYTASKAALIGLTHSLARPLAPHGVTVNAVAPALIEGGATLPGAEDEAGRRELAKRLPIQRLGRTEEVAEAVLALVTNPFITAQTLSVDGGMYPR